MRAALRFRAAARSTLALLSAVGILVLADEALAECKKGFVFVKSKTPLRRGPGLNFPVSTMLEDGKCRKLAEVSTDQNWMLIDDTESKQLGWVPASALDSSDLTNLGAPPPKPAAPVGSGQRGFVTVRAKSSMLSLPRADADVRRSIPAGTRVLALSVSKDEKFVEVRDDRGEVGWVAMRAVTDDAAVLPTLPRESKTIVHLPPKSTTPPSKARRPQPERPPDEKRDPGFNDIEDPDDPDERRPPRKIEKRLLGEVLLLGTFPQHGLDSNGAAGYRRYTVRAFAPGLHLGAKVVGHAPVAFRFGYDFTLMSGLAPINDPDRTVAAQQHDARAVLGYPVYLGDVLITPEAGLTFVRFAMQPALPGSVELQFISTNHFGVQFGGTAEYAFTPEFDFQGELSALVTATSEGPVDLGGAGLTFGIRFGLDAKYEVSPGASMMGFFNYVWRRSPFSGQSITDPTITTASLTHAEILVGLGVAIALD